MEAVRLSSSFPLNSITASLLLHSIFLLLNLQPLASHHLVFETLLLTFPGSYVFNPLGSDSRKNGFAPIMGILGLLNKEEDLYHTGGLHFALKL